MLGGWRRVAVLVGHEPEIREESRRSFDSARRDETATGSAQDDTSNLTAGGMNTVGRVGLRLPRLNENQLAVMAELAAVGGRMRVLDLRGSLPGVPESTLGTSGEAGVGGD